MANKQTNKRNKNKQSNAVEEPRKARHEYEVYLVQVWHVQWLQEPGQDPGLSPVQKLSRSKEVTRVTRVKVINFNL